MCFPLRRDSAALKHNELSRQLCQLMGGVRHIDQRDAGCGQPLREMRDQLLSMICIIRRKGFIQQEQSRSHQQSAGECYPLSLSAGKNLCGLAQQMI